MSWDEHAAKMDAIVDDKLGDSISYSTDGGLTFKPIQGFVLPDGAGIAAGIDGDFGYGQLSGEIRVKIRKSLIPTPAQNHRIKSPRLGNDTYKPKEAEPDDQGRYYVFSIQRARK